MEQVGGVVVEGVGRLPQDELARLQALAGAGEWFIESDGAPIGPLTTAQLRERWRAHRLERDARCWGAGLAGWTPVHLVTSLMRELGRQPLAPVTTPRPPPVPIRGRRPPPVLKPVPLPKKKSVLPEIAPPPPERSAPVLSARRVQPLALEPAPARRSAWIGWVLGASVVAAGVAALGAYVLVPARAAEPAVVTHTAPHPVSGGQLSEVEITAVVLSHKAEVVRCQDAAAAEDPDLAGRLMMRWTIGTDGAARDVEAAGGDLQHSPIAACLTQVISTWRFPRHPDEQPAISFPFMF